MTGPRGAETGWMTPGADPAAGRSPFPAGCGPTSHARSRPWWWLPRALALSCPQRPPWGAHWTESCPPPRPRFRPAGGAAGTNSNRMQRGGGVLDPEGFLLLLAEGPHFEGPSSGLMFVPPPSLSLNGGVGLKGQYRTEK